MTNFKTVPIKILFDFGTRASLVTFIYLLMQLGISIKKIIFGKKVEIIPTLFDGSY